MNELDDNKRKLRRARQHVTKLLRSYYAALKAKCEQDALMERVAKLLSK